jgi:hypothetical protein
MNKPTFTSQQIEKGEEEGGIFAMMREKDDIFDPRILSECPPRKRDKG